MKILLTGDYFYNYKKEHKDFSKIRLFLNKYDACLINWEGSYIGDSNQRVNKSVNLEFSSQGINLPENSILSLSNNHVYDYGSQGLDRTISKIENKGYKWFGLQSNSKIFDNFEIISIGDIKICFVGFGWKNEECKIPTNTSSGVPDFTKKNIDSSFNKLRKFEYDLLICYTHIGYEFEYYPLPLHVGLSRYLVDKGCDLVYSSHTHSLQPYEFYKGTYIFYGLGNFYFSSLRSRFPVISDIGLAIELNIINKIINKVKPIDVVYDRAKNNTKISAGSEFLTTHKFKFGALDTYSKVYKQIRIRKKNPRPIMYFETGFINATKYILWLVAVKITGILRIRRLIKTLLGWN